MTTAPCAELPTVLRRRERRDAEDENAVDFSLHGLVSIRLLSPQPRDVARFRERFGPVSRGASREHDLRIRFVDELRLPASACHLGSDAAFTTDSFYLCRPRTSDRALATLPVDQLGRGAEICVERGSEAPLLADLINLAVLAQGGLALHAATVDLKGRGCVIAGWPHGGKTAALIGMIAAGARYVSDDWSYLHPDAERVFGSKEPIDVRERYLQDAPELLTRISAKSHTQLAALRAASAGARSAVKLTRSAAPAKRVAARVAHALEERRKLRIAPGQLFGEANCRDETRLDTFILCLAHGEPHIEVRQLSSSEAIPRVLMSLEYERKRLSAYYLQFRSAFPDRRNPLLEQASALEEQRLRRALNGKAVYLVCHPHHARPHALAAALQPLVREARP